MAHTEIRITGRVTFREAVLALRSLLAMKNSNFNL